jgi:hypothetical protein
MTHKRSAVLALAAFFLAMGAAPAWGHDFSLSTSFDCLGAGCAQSPTHDEADPFKGWANLTLTNTGTEDWGDLHLAIFQVTAQTIENVDFIVSAPYQPTSSQSGLTWSVDNAAVGATLDLYFYSDPVQPGDTATFSVYTDNTTDQVDFFGTLFYPTPVPEPGTALLLASGLIGLAIKARERKA